MTNLIRGSDGLPRTDIVQPVPEIKGTTNENNPFATQAAKEEALRKLNEILQKRKFDAAQRGGVDETA